MRRPGAVGKNITSTEQLVLGPVEALHVVSVPEVKSRLCWPEVNTLTAPKPPEPPVVKGNVRVTGVELPSGTWPKPTAVLLSEYVESPATRSALTEGSTTTPWLSP